MLRSGLLPLTTFARQAAWAAAAALLGLAAPGWAADAPPPMCQVNSSANDRGPVCMNAFYEVLSDYGSWLDTDRLGTVFCPSSEIFGADFRPYSKGHWVMSESGWTFVGEHSTSWVTDHYGRWVHTALRGCPWAWVPGDAWSPAWVDFRVGERIIAWRPAPFDGVPVRLQLPHGVSLPRVQMAPLPPPSPDAVVAVTDTDFNANHIQEVALSGPDLYAAVRDTTPLQDIRAGLHSKTRYEVVAQMLEARGIVRPTEPGEDDDDDSTAGPPEPAKRLPKRAPLAGSVRSGKNGENPSSTPPKPGDNPPGSNKGYGPGDQGTGGFTRDGAPGGVKVLDWGKPKKTLPKPDSR